MLREVFIDLVGVLETGERDNCFALAFLGGRILFEFDRNWLELELAKKFFDIFVLRFLVEVSQHKFADLSFHNAVGSVDREARRICRVSRCWCSGRSVLDRILLIYWVARLTNSAVLEGVAN